MLVVPQLSSVFLLEQLRNFFLSGGTFMHLFKNDYHPISTTLVGDLVESTFPGYAASITGWSTAAFLNGFNKAEVDADLANVFTCSGSASETVYGYWVMDPTDTALLWAERFLLPVPLSTAGQFVSVLARLTALTEFTGP